MIFVVLAKFYENILGRSCEFGLTLRSQHFIYVGVFSAKYLSTVNLWANH